MNAHAPEPAIRYRDACRLRKDAGAALLRCDIHVAATKGDRGYEVMAQGSLELALKQPGCLGAEGVCDAGGLGIAVSYFTDEPAIHAWKQNAQHLVAQRLGMEHWYSHYELRIAKVERAYSGPLTAVLLD
jgi:heme-degrading monooxygenase HmoA